MRLEELLLELEIIEEEYTHTAQWVTVVMQTDCSGTVYDDFIVDKYEIAEFDSAADFEDVIRTVKEYYEERK